MQANHDLKIDFPIAGEVLFISEKKLHHARRSKRQVLINIYDGKIVKRNGKDKWQFLGDIGNGVYRWIKSDWGDSEYLDNGEYLPLPKDPPRQSIRTGKNSF